MRDLKTTLTTITGLFLTFAAAFAADVQMTIQPQLISLLDRAVLKVEFIDTKGDAVDFPKVDGLNIQYQGQSSSFNFVNGRQSSTYTHNYLVTPTKVGDFTIGPVKAKYKGGEKELTAQLRVIKKEDDKEAQQISEIMFSRIKTARNAPYVHEPFALELKVSIRDDVQIDGNFSIRGGLPESGLDGEIAWQMVDQKREEKNGAIFNTYMMSGTTKALTAGTFSFQPQVQVNVVVPRQRRRPYGFDDPFFGDFFGRQETRPMILDCNKLDVDVQPIPTAGRPESFTGGVGIFDFDVSVGPKKVKAGEPITVKMRIAGNGNIEKITPPLIKDDHHFKLYDARTLPASSPNEVIFEQVIIPKSDEVKAVPEIAFSYFNSKTADFRTIRQGPFPVEIEAVPQQTAQVIAATPNAVLQETKVLGRDIVYLKPLPEKWKYAGDAGWYHSLPAQILLISPAALLALIGGSLARRRRLENNVALARRQKAPKASRKHVQRAEQALKKQDEAAFYQAAWDALADYFGHRLNLPPGDVSLPVVLSRLPKEHEAIETLFSTIEQRRYGLGSGAEPAKEEMKQMLKLLTSTLSKCERMKL